MGHKSKKSRGDKKSHTVERSNCSCCDTTLLGIGALQALGRKKDDCLVRLCVATTPGGGDDELAVRRFPTGAIPGNDIILNLPRLYSVLWDRCNPEAVARPFCQTWLRVCVDGYMATRFLVPAGDGRFRVNTTPGISVNFRSQPKTTSLILGGIPDSFIVQGLGDPLVENDGFLFRHVRVCGWAFAGFLADCKCLEGLNGGTFSSVPTGGEVSLGSILDPIGGSNIPFDTTDLSDCLRGNILDCLGL